jgi:soluble lytic murein transglycosylase-like protein
MSESGTLSASEPQRAFSRSYRDGVGQAPSATPLPLFDEDKPGRSSNRSVSTPGRAPRPEILSAIEATALRYARHPGLRAAGITTTGWLNLYRANIEIESAYNPKALSHAGAVGLGQLMPGTAAALGVDPHDWHRNLDGSARYLALMLAEFGDVRLALAAYNAGPEAVRGHGGVPPFQETRTHVQRVLAVFNRLEGKTS